METIESNIGLGDEVEDTVTGLKGMVVALCKYLNGCVQAEVQPRLDKDGKWMASRWIDIPQLKKVPKKKVPKKEEAQKEIIVCRPVQRWGPGNHPERTTPGSNAQKGWDRIAEEE